MPLNSEENTRRINRRIAEIVNEELNDDEVDKLSIIAGVARSLESLLKPAISLSKFPKESKLCELYPLLLELNLQMFDWFAREEQHKCSSQPTA